jgi:hypothetical protein
MSKIDFVIIFVIILIMTLAILKIVRDKKSGKKCVGCSSECSCDIKKDKNK